MVNEVFTGECEGVGVNEKGDFEIFKEKSYKEKQESNEQLDTRDMPELESEESAAKRRNQQGQGLKILTPDQMLNRLPITLAQKQEIIHKNLRNQATVVFFVQIRKTHKTTL